MPARVTCSCLYSLGLLRFGRLEKLWALILPQCCVDLIGLWIRLVALGATGLKLEPGVDLGAEKGEVCGDRLFLFELQSLTVYLGLT